MNPIQQLIEKWEAQAESSWEKVDGSMEKGDYLGEKVARTEHNALRKCASDLLAAIPNPDKWLSPEDVAQRDAQFTKMRDAVKNWFTLDEVAPAHLWCRREREFRQAIQEVWPDCVPAILPKHP